MIERPVFEHEHDHMLNSLLPRDVPGAPRWHGADHDIAGLPNGATGTARGLKVLDILKGPRSTALSKVVVTLQLSEAQTGPVFQLRYCDLRCPHVEGFFKTGQVFDLVLTE